MSDLSNGPMPNPNVPKTDVSQIGDHRLNTQCGVVERPDHHCGDDLVALRWHSCMNSAPLEHKMCHFVFYHNSVISVIILAPLCRFSSKIFRQNALRRFALMWWPAYAGVVVVVSTKWGSRISRERFDLESPNFAWTFIPVGSATTPDMTSLYTSGQKLPRKKPSKMHPQTASGGISRKRCNRGSPNFTWLSGTTGATNLPDLASLGASGRLNLQLNTAQKWCIKWVRPAKESNNSAIV